MTALRFTTALTLLALAAEFAAPASTEAQADQLGAPPSLEVEARVEAEVEAEVVTPSVEETRTVRVIAVPAAPVSPAPPPAPTEARGSASRAHVPGGYGDYAPLPAQVAAPPAAASTPVQVTGPNPIVHHEDSPSRLPRIAVMLAAGGATMAGVGFGFYAAGCAMGGNDSCVETGALLAAPAAASLTPLAVFLSGNAMGGNGGYGWALMGTGIGIGAGLLGTTMMFLAGGNDETLLIPLMVAPVLGSVIAYEASSDPSREWADAQPAPQSLQWSASVAPIDRGAVAAVSGTF